jgi:hypothetical protein
MLRPPRRSDLNFREDEITSKKVDPALYDTPFEELELDSEYGYKLYGRYYRQGGSKYVLLLHGHNSNSSGVVRFMKVFYDRGYNIIIPDHRYSGRSGGKCITYGLKEHRDVLKFIEYIRENDSAAEIGVFGESMGAATALMTAGADAGLKFCVEYCGYAAMEKAIRREVERMASFARIFLPLVKVFMRIFGGFKMEDVQPAEAAKNIKCPVLIMHSEMDERITFPQHKTIAENLTVPHKIITFPRNYHGRSLTYDKDKFEGSINEFLNEIGY